MIKKMKEKKGFTLVELIVVLVILAILAALLIPALTGYIQKAKEKQLIAETRQCVMAAQTLADEITGTLGSGDYADSSATGFSTSFKEDVEKLAEVDENTVTEVTITEGKVVTLTYTEGTDKCDYKATLATGEQHYTVTKVTP